MRTFALLLLGAMVVSLPARADFFQDLGFALGKLGDKIEDTFTADNPAPSEAAQPAPATAQPAEDITWNPVPEGALWVPEAVVLPKPKPKLAAYEIKAQIRDDAPAPKPAPPRKPVQTLAALAPLPGYTQAPPPTLRPVVAFDAPPSKPALPKAKPAKPLAANFSLRYGLKGVIVEDARLASPLAPLKAEEKKLLESLLGATSRPATRLRVVAEAKGAEGEKLAFSRALMVKHWLETTGVRPTQIDLEVRPTSTSDLVSLIPYRIQ